MPWTKEKALGLFRQIGVVPVVRVATSEEAFCAVEGIMGAGIVCQRQ